MIRFIWSVERVGTKTFQGRRLRDYGVLFPWFNFGLTVMVVERTGK